MLIKFFSTAVIALCTVVGAVDPPPEYQLGANYEPLKAAMKAASIRIAPGALPPSQLNPFLKDVWASGVVKALIPVNDELANIRKNWAATLVYNRANAYKGEWVGAMVRESTELNSQWYAFGKNLRNAQARYPAGLNDAVFTCLSTAELNMIAIAKLVNDLATEVLVVYPGSIRVGAVDSSRTGSF